MQDDFYTQALDGVMNGFLQAFLQYWYILIFPLLVFLVKISLSLYKIRNISKAGLAEIDKMSGTEFEIYLEKLFTRLGYKVERVGHVADYGGDLVIIKDNVRTVVQAKRWSSPVNVKAIQEINSAKAHYNSSKAMVITNNRFTSNAVILAKENDVNLIGRTKLADLILKSNKKY